MILSQNSLDFVIPNAFLHIVDDLFRVNGIETHQDSFFIEDAVVKLLLVNLKNLIDFTTLVKQVFHVNNLMIRIDVFSG